MKKIIISVLVLLTVCSNIVFFSNTVHASAATNQEAVEQKADDIIDTAISLLGKATYNRFVYDTEKLEFGCTGYIYYAFLQNGIDLNTRSTQFLSEMGEYVPKDQLQKGDLVFFDSILDDEYAVSHNGMYIGDNKIIHMADSTNNVIISDLDGKSYYRDYYVFARRVIPGFMPSANPGTGDKIVDYAESLIGQINYGAYDETTLTFDNTGFMYYLFKEFDIDLESVSSAKEQAELGVYVPKDQLKKGDLLYYSNDNNQLDIRLVGVYAGNNNVIINASSYTGLVKRNVSRNFYKNNYITARRIIPETTPADRIIDTAESLWEEVNYGYPYNEETLTFDSGGFTLYVFKLNNIDLKTRFASQQSKLGTYIPKEELQKGDVVFFSKDVSPDKIWLSGIYIGDNSVIMNANYKTGAIICDISNGYYERNYKTSRRFQQD